ncbi:MAG: DUF6110 family protein [Synergistaceae bacterium]|jgi:hypothetical protein|nr:DUF6110 family protein [Synergistaceae bacterium]
MKYGNLILFAAGAAVGAGAVWLVTSGNGKKSAVAIVSKGMELKERVAGMAERVKEAADDVVAEAKYINEQKAGARGE